MISDRHTVPALATLLSIPPILLVAAAVNRLLPPPPRVPAVVAANDRRVDALHAPSKTAGRSSVDRPFAGPK